jgi:hypothetical protein
LVHLNYLLSGVIAVNESRRRKEYQRAAPVVLFAYNRPKCFMRTLKALAANELAESTSLYLFLDGPKNEHDGVFAREIENYFDNIQGFLEKTKYKRSSNLGLKKNIVSGVSQILKHHDRAIFLEDDLVTSPYFLKYMNSSLELYETNPDVCQISGYSYLERYFKPSEERDTYFMRGGDCLAWGTWRRSWVHYVDDSKALLSEIYLRKLSKSFDRGGVYPFTQMLSDNITTERSWAINWYASTFLLNKYCLYPVKSLALHFPGDEGATNYTQLDSDPLMVPLADEPVIVGPIEVQEERVIACYYKQFLRQFRARLTTRVVKKIVCFARKIASVARKTDAH